ncbi:MAG TPA: Tol-Pal system beta propeller repeat protein TolB [Pseudomonadales bacterium]
MIKRLLLLVWLSLPLAVSAELVIEITQGVDNPTPMAVSPFSWSGTGALEEDVSAIIEANLSRSGLFDLLARENMLSHPDKPQNVFYRDWRALGREYLLIGSMTPVDDMVEVRYHLFDIVRQSTLLSYQLRASRSGLRDLAHRISDQVFEKITNIRGAFSTKMLYVSASNLPNGQYNYQLYIADADGARPRRILNSDEPILAPAWSPDGKQIAYVSFESSRPAVYRHVLATGEREKLTSFPGINSSPAWSPDGRKMALSLSKDGSPDIYILDLQSRQLRKIAANDLAIDTEPYWMPDGKSIVFTSNRGGQPQIYRADLVSGAVDRVTFEGRYNARARPMPDGSGLILVHQAGNGDFHIARFDQRSGRMHILTSTQLDESPSIAANGSMVMYATKRGEQGILAAVSIDGRVKFSLPSHGRDVREPAWSPFFD